MTRTVQRRILSCASTAATSEASIYSLIMNLTIVIKNSPYTVQPSCPYLEGKGYASMLGFHFKVYTDRNRSYIEARDLCKRDGADLPVFEKEHEVKGGQYLAGKICIIFALSLRRSCLLKYCIRYQLCITRSLSGSVSPTPTTIRSRSGLTSG